MKNKTKFIQSAFFGYGLTFMLVLGYGLIAILILLPSEQSFFESNLFSISIPLFMLVVLPTALWIFGIHMGFSVIEINEEGISRSLFKIFCKRKFCWNEIIEIRKGHRLNDWIFIGKIEMGNLSYEELVKNINVMHLSYSLDLCKAIWKFSNKVIIGFDNELVEKIENS